MCLTSVLTDTLTRFTTGNLHLQTAPPTPLCLDRLIQNQCRVKFTGVIMQRAGYKTLRFHSSFWACVNHLNLPCDTFSSHILPVKIRRSYVEPYCSSSPSHRWTLEQDSGWLGPPVRMWWTLNYLADRRYSPPVRNRGLCLARPPLPLPLPRSGPPSNKAETHPHSAKTTFLFPPHPFTSLLLCVKSHATLTCAKMHITKNAVCSKWSF